MVNRFFLYLLVPLVVAYKQRNIYMTSSTPKHLKSHVTQNVKYATVAASLFASIMTVTITPQVSRAGLFSSDEQDLIDEIAKSQKPVNELLMQLTPSESPNAIGVYIKQQILKGGKEDSDVVANYLSLYINPMQAKMAKVAPLLKVDGSSQERLLLLPSLMKGHILELGQAISSQKAESQAREVQEVQETLYEFLSLVSASGKYNVQLYTPAKPLSDKDLFGPFGCEFYGKKRVAGSNACTTD